MKLMLFNWTIFVIHFLVIVNITFISGYEVQNNLTATNADQLSFFNNGYTNDATVEGQRNFDDDGVFWSNILEDFTLKQSIPREREGRIIQSSQNRYIPTTSGNFYISRRIGEALDPEPLYRRPPGTGKVISTSHSSHNQIPHQSAGNPTRQNNGGNQFVGSGSSREVSETDLYLLSAIEKLVYRVDYLEQRLRRTEQIVYYLMAGNKEKPEAALCPENFTRIGETCYFFGTDRGLNWKSANTMCKSLGAHLAEFDTIAKYREVVAVILNSASQRGKDFWLGGLNPGLLWIWTNTAKPVNPNFNITSLSTPSTAPTESGTKIVNNKENKKKETNKNKDKTSTNDSDPPLEIEGNGRCLRLSYNPSAHKYVYYGQECSVRHNYLCALTDKTIDNEIKRIAKELNLN